MILLQSATSPFGPCSKLGRSKKTPRNDIKPLRSPLLTRLEHVFFFWWFLGIKDLTTKMKEKGLFHEEKWYWNNVIPNHSYGYGSTIGVPTCALFLGPQKKLTTTTCHQKRCSYCLCSIIFCDLGTPHLCTFPASNLSIPHLPTWWLSAINGTKFHLADDLQRLRKAAYNSSWYELYWTVIREIPQHYHKLVYNCIV